MIKSGVLCAGIVFAACAVVYSGTVFAEVYKWVDEQGNVHFGDKPVDKEQAEKAERVDIVEGYQPAVRTTAEEAEYERELEAMKRRRELYAEEDAKVRKEEKEKREAALAELCDALRTEIAKFSEIHTESGVPTYYYLLDEDGESVSSERQKEYVGELKKRYSAAGCK